MSENKSMLCVGGPLAGKRRAILYGNGFVVPVLKDADLAATHLPVDDPKATTDFVRVGYRSEVFRTPDGDVSFWVPEDQTPLETITLLLETYEKARAL